MNTVGRGRRGFTLVELLVVIAIIGILIALLLPAVQAAREAARRAQCTDHLHNLGLAVHNYHDVYKNFPLNYADWNVVTPDQGRSITWITSSLPFIEQQPLFDAIDFRYGIRNDPRNPGTLAAPANLWAARQKIPILLCPSDSAEGVLNNRANLEDLGFLGVTNYKGCAGANWAWGTWPVTGKGHGTSQWGTDGNGLDAGNGVYFRCGFIKDVQGNAYAPKFSLVQDGTSNTFLFGEAIPVWCQHTSWWWFNHTTATCAVPLNARAQCQNTGGKNADLIACFWDWPNNYSFMSKHPGGANFCMVDGSVRFIANAIDITNYRSLATEANGEVIQSQ